MSSSSSAAGSSSAASGGGASRDASGRRVVHIRVRLNADRAVPGWMTVEVDGVEVAKFAVLGRGSDERGKGAADTGARRAWRSSHGGTTWQLADGDTPPGTYDGSTWVDTSNSKRWSEKSYGSHGAVRLTPLAGDAIEAQGLGRAGLLIHGGAPGRFKGLNATHGCLRLSNADIVKLKRILDGAADDEERKVCAWPVVRVTVE